MRNMLKAAAQAAMKFLVIVAIACVAPATVLAWGMPTGTAETVKRAIDNALAKCQSEVDKAQAAANANGYSGADFAKLEVAYKNLEAAKQQAVKIEGRLNALKRVVKLNRSDLEWLATEVGKMKGLQKADHEQLIQLTGRVINHEQRLQGVEGQLPHVAAQAARAERIAVEARDGSTEIDSNFGVFTGKGPGSGESGLQMGFCARGKQNGIGGCVDASAGFVGITGDKDPHPTSVIVKAGPSFRWGDSDSPFELGVSALLGAGAATSLSVDPRFVAGYAATMNLRWGRFSPIPLTLGAYFGQAWGGHEGAIGAVTLGFDPIAGSKLANRKKVSEQPAAQAEPNAPTLAPVD